MLQAHPSPPPKQEIKIQIGIADIFSGDLYALYVIFVLLWRDE